MSNSATLIRELCDLEIAGELSFSPDGERILYSTRLSWGSQKGRHPVSTIWLATVSQAFSSQPITSGAFNDFSPRWCSSQDKIAFISDRAGPGEKWAIYTQSISPPDSVVAVTPTGNEQPINTFQLSPDGHCIAYLSADEISAEQKEREKKGENVQIWGQDWPYVRLRTVVPQTKEIRTLALERTVSSFCWSPTGEEIALASCETTDFEAPFTHGITITIVNRELTSIRHVCAFPSDIRDLTWADDGKLYFWAGVPAGSKFAGYGIYAVDHHALSPSYTHVAFAIEDDAFALAKAHGQLIAKVSHRLEDRIVRLSGEMLYSKKQELEAFDVGASVGMKAPMVAVATSDVNHPVEVYVTTDGGKSMLQLSNHGKSFVEQQFGICHYLSCMSVDGQVELDSLFLEPASQIAPASKGTDRTPLPTVVLVHGGPTTRLTNAFNAYYYMWAPYLLSLGIGVLIPNYRGSCGRGETFASYSIGGVGIYDYADILATTQLVIDMRLADPERMIIGGWSQGGLLANLCSVRNGLHGRGWRFKAAISGASVSDIDSMALTSEMGSSYHPELHRGDVIWNMDLSNTFCRHGSALWSFKAAMTRSRTEGISIIPPMLILHGAEDKRCPVSQAWGLRRALESYSLPFQLAIYPRQGHFFHTQAFWIDMALRIGRWCEHHLLST